MLRISWRLSWLNPDSLLIRRVTKRVASQLRTIVELVHDPYFYHRVNPQHKSRTDGWFVLQKDRQCTAVGYYLGKVAGVLHENLEQFPADDAAFLAE